MPPPAFVRDLATSPAFILFVYLACVVPLGLYVLHDVLDPRWRRVQNLHFFFVFYGLLFCITFPILCVYAAFQIAVHNFSEAGTTLVVVIVALHGARKLWRLRQILHIHQRIIHGPVTKAHQFMLLLMPGREPSAGEHHNNFRIDNWQYFWKNHVELQFVRADADQTAVADRPTNSKQQSSDQDPSHHFDNADIEPRGHYLSSFIFDDDFPGDDSSRIKFVNSRWPWFHLRPYLVSEDIHECAMRMALYLRFALRPPRYEIWTAIVATHKLVTIAGHTSLGKALRRLVNSGSDKGPNYVRNLCPDWDKSNISATTIVTHNVLRNPVQDMLHFANNLDAANIDSRTDLKAVGASLFWITAQQYADNTVTSLSIFPRRWLRGAQQNGRQLVFEICVYLMLAGHQMRTEAKKRGRLRRIDVAGRDGKIDVESQTRVRQGTLRKTFNSVKERLFRKCTYGAEEYSDVEFPQDASNVLHPVIPVYDQSFGTSWTRDFQNEPYRKRLAMECARAVSSFLVPEQNRTLRGESTILHSERYVQDADNPTNGSKIAKICEEAFIAAFDAFTEKDVVEIPNGVRGNSARSDGMFVGTAIQELVATTEHAGMLAEALIGPEMIRRIKQEFGDEATIRNAGIIFGLAAIVTHLKLGKCATDRMLDHWWSHWKYAGKRADDLLQVVKARIISKFSSTRQSKLSGAEWMARGEEKDYIDQRCPDYVDAFVAYARMAALMAEGVFVALCAWTKHPEAPYEEDPCPPGDETEGSTSFHSPSKLQFTFPNMLGTPREMQESFFKWKQNQGRATAGSTYALMYNLPQPMLKKQDANRR